LTRYFVTPFTLVRRVQQILGDIPPKRGDIAQDDWPGGSRLEAHHLDN